MLTVAFSAFKVIGIIIGSLLGLLLLLVLLILFLPVRYRGDGHRNEDGMGLQVKLRWLFGLVRVHFCYPKPGNWVVKLLCFTIYKSGGGTSPGQDKDSKSRKTQKSKNTSNTKPAKRTKTEKDSRGKKRSAQNTDSNLIQYESLSLPSDKDQDNQFSPTDMYNDHQPAQSDTDQDHQSSQSDIDQDYPYVWSKTNTSSADEAHSQPNQSQENEAEASPHPQKKSLWHRFLAFLYKWLAFFQQKLSDGTYYLNLLRAEETLEMYHRTKDRLRKVLRSLRPRKLKANIHFGTGSPDTTGLAYGLCSMLYPYFGKYINITPNFEKAMFLGDVSLSGWAVGWVIIAGVLRISLDKGIRQFLKKWKREVA
jgi:hypothetical protein